METFLEENVINLNKLPHRLCYNKMVRVSCDVIMEEIASIINECSVELDGPFVSLAADHYRDRARREDYGLWMHHL